MTAARKSASGLKSAKGNRTIGALMDARRMRSSAGALQELSSLATERHRLQQELDRWRNRHAEIQVRLGEIAAKERKLFAFVKGAPPDPVASAKPVPRAAGLRRMNTRELNY